MAVLMQVFLLLASSTIVTSKCLKGNEVTAFSYLQPDKNSPESAVKGTVKLIQHKTGGQTYFKIKISGLPPDTAHGFHVHVSGDIFSEGCTSAGGHYNPFNQTHGAPTDTIRHVGDLGNVYSNKKGNVVVIKRDSLVSLVGVNSVIGRAIVLHAKKDDLGRGGDKASKTTGNAGARIACGVIIRAW